MSKRTMTIERLDPTKTVHHTSISSEHDKPLHFDKDGNQIAWIEETVPYKPEYDYETKSIKHWWYRNSSTLYRDVHHEVVTFRSRNMFSKILKSIKWVLLDKYLIRFFKPTEAREV